jgi:hypothetical protein
MTCAKQRVLEGRDWSNLRILIVNKPENKKRNVVGILATEEIEECCVLYEEGATGRNNAGTEIDNG